MIYTFTKKTLFKFEGVNGVHNVLLYKKCALIQRISLLFSMRVL